MENKKKSSAGLPAQKKSVLEDKNGEDFAILSSRFKEKKERTNAGKGNGKKDDQIKVENQKKKEALEEVMKTNILK